MNNKTTKRKTIIAWILAGLVGFIYIGSGTSKIIAGDAIIQMASNFGIPVDTYRWLGVIEIICAILFLIPRTGIIGTLLLSAYMGGGIATHLEHQESIIPPCVVLAFTLTAALYRFPALTQSFYSQKS